MRVTETKGRGLMIIDGELKASLNSESNERGGQAVGGKKKNSGGFLGWVTDALPDAIWLPTGSGGIAFRLGYRHRVDSVQTSRDMKDQIDICGVLYFGDYKS